MNRELARQASNAAAYQVERFTVGYSYLHGFDGDKVGHGSGTTVRIGDHFFIATVGHARPIDNSSISVFVPVTHHTSWDEAKCVIRRVAAHDAIDVAAFELRPTAVDRLGFEFVGLDRIHDAHTGDASLLAKLSGKPSKFIRRRDQDTGETWGLTYGCEPIDPARWDSIEVDFESERPNPELHIVTEFTKDVLDLTEQSLPLPKGMPDPFGLSGGGIWQQRRRTEKRELWIPDALHLIGIQSTWFSKTYQFLKLVQIIHWLKLVADNYSVLRGQIYEQFPRVETIGQ